MSRYYVIINNGQYNKLINEDMKAKKNYKPKYEEDENGDIVEVEYELKDVVTSVIGQLTNNNYVFQACLSDFNYIDSKCTKKPIDEDELNMWKDEFGEENIITSLDGLEFKEVEDL